MIGGSTGADTGSEAGLGSLDGRRPNWILGGLTSSYFVKVPLTSFNGSTEVPACLRNHRCGGAGDAAGLVVCILQCWTPLP